MIFGICRSNHDRLSHELEWPTVFVGIPTIGHRVRARSGRIGYVCNVEHYQVAMNPRIEVELTIFEQSIHGMSKR